MRVDVPTVVAALEAAIHEQRAYAGEECPYELGYLAALERAADIVVAKAYGLATGAEA